MARSPFNGLDTVAAESMGRRELKRHGRLPLNSTRLCASPQIVSTRGPSDAPNIVRFLRASAHYKTANQYLVVVEIAAVRFSALRVKNPALFVRYGRLTAGFVCQGEAKLDAAVDGIAKAIVAASSAAPASARALPVPERKP